MKRRDHTAKSKDEAVTYKGSHQPMVRRKALSAIKRRKQSKKLSKLTNLETPKS